MDVSIVMLTYNHQRYIRAALDSILMQKHDLQYQILIVDDASKDGTVDILREYKRKYPRIINLLCKKTNSGYPTKNVYIALQKAKGKYIAFLEGDDYWTDEYKIKKQYDLLEGNKRYSACTGNICVVDEASQPAEGVFYTRQPDGIYSMEKFKTLEMPAMSCCFFTRNFYKEYGNEIIYQADRIMGDITSFMLALMRGDIYQFDECFAAYRYVCKEGENNYNSINKENKYKKYNLIRYWLRLEKYLKDNYDKKFTFKIIKEEIAACKDEYSAKAMLRLTLETKNLEKMLFYMAVKHTDIYCLEPPVNLVEKAKSWNSYVRDKQKVILFGAGYMASKYLDLHAWENNILFIVDNDKEKQNTSFKGYAIKEPEEIIKYKNKCKVLIVNKNHEADIERQLESMDIDNYYGYYSMQFNRIINKLLRTDYR